MKNLDFEIWDKYFIYEILDFFNKEILFFNFLLLKMKSFEFQICILYHSKNLLCNNLYKIKKSIYKYFFIFV